MRLTNALTPLVVGQEQEEGDTRHQLFTQKPCLSMDNHFSGKNVDHHLGSNGYNGVYTSACGRLQASVQKYYHHVKAVNVGPHSRAARFANPVVAVKEVVGDGSIGNESYRVVHVSFQSTGSTDITTVNTLDEVDLYVRQREKGRASTKRIWAIEMNEGRELYLKTYGGVNQLDHLIEDWKLRYRTWRWWHAPTQHETAIAYSQAWTIYATYASGHVDPAWEVDKPMICPEFCQQQA